MKNTFREYAKDFEKRALGKTYANPKLIITNLPLFENTIKKCVLWQIHASFCPANQQTDISNSL